MNIEFILWWLLAGFIADGFLSVVITFRHRHSMEEIYAKYKKDQPPYFHDYVKIFIETPWWARLIIYVLPPSILIHPAISNEYY